MKLDRIAIFEQQWIDPVREDQELTTFGTYTQFSRSFDGSSRGSYQIYLPPDYAEEPERRFPVLYWLHGGFAHSREGLPVVARIDRAIRSGALPPVIVVLPQSLPVGWYVDSRDGIRPVEQSVANCLVQHVDTTYRTVAHRDARFLEGFSMGGYGALHLGLKYPKLFGRISAIAPSILRDMAQEPEERIANTFFGDRKYYDAVGPWTLALGNAPEVRRTCRIRVLSGTRDDRLAPTLRDFSAHLTSLAVPHEFHEVDGVGHEFDDIIGGLGETYFTFWRD
ncbi:alpha/beta hydrolase [Streptomyces sp. cg40]|uniref:alpha/beta hydrolase n=1 Tax=Streptomyces sp. cg40 TaxID=3419764 RepID=UPI003D00154B